MTVRDGFKGKQLIIDRKYLIYLGKTGQQVEEVICAIQNPVIPRDLLPSLTVFLTVR